MAIKIPTVNEKLLERYVRHSVYLEQLKIGEAKLISRFLKQKTFPRIYEKLIKELGKVKNLETLGSIRKIPIRRLKRMLAATQKISTAGMVRAEKMSVNRLVNISKFEAQWNADLISKTVPVDIDMTMPSNTVLRNLVTMRPMDGHKLGTWMKGYSTAVRMAMTKQIKVGIATGESLPNIAKRINRTLNWKGKQAEYIARTAVSNVVHHAREEVFKKNTDIVRKVQWISTLDDRTSMQCIHLDGRMFDIGDGPRPPIHFNCRSSIIPITPSWQEFRIVDPPPATRASMNGAVPAKMTYRQWIKKQPKAVQVKVLGKKRTELYRSGRVKIDRFVGKDLKPLNLKQLAKREGIDIELPEVLPAPPRVKAMPTKGIGKLTKTDIKRLNDYTWSEKSGNVVKAQLGKPLRKDWRYGDSKTNALIEGDKIEKVLRKMEGFKGTTYRGLEFITETQRKEFLNQFKKGGIWKSKSLQSTSKDLFTAEAFASKVYNPVMLEIKGLSGRNISKVLDKPFREVLFAKGTPFKVDKIVGNKVYLSEITKQVQLIKPLKGVSFEGVHVDYKSGLTNELNRLAKKFPKIKNKFGGSRIVSRGKFNRLTMGENDALAVVTTEKGKEVISLNARFFGAQSKLDVNAGVSRLHKMHWLASTKAENLMTHEFGHVLQSSLAQKYQRKVFDFWLNASPTTMKQIKKQISKYAAESSKELFAESFTQWQIGKASPVAKKVLKMSGVLK